MNNSDVKTLGYIGCVNADQAGIDASTMPRQSDGQALGLIKT
jgi:hypothetical protein